MNDSFVPVPVTDYRACAGIARGDPRKPFSNSALTEPDVCRLSDIDLPGSTGATFLAPAAASSEQLPEGGSLTEPSLRNSSNKYRPGSMVWKRGRDAEDFGESCRLFGRRRGSAHFHQPNEVSGDPDLGMHAEFLLRQAEGFPLEPVDQHGGFPFVGNS
jgi:hypothetical protein